MDTNISMNKTFVVNRCEMDNIKVVPSKVVPNMDIEEVLRHSGGGDKASAALLDSKLEELKRDRKRRASADPDKFTQPNLKRPLSSSLAKILLKTGQVDGEADDGQRHVGGGSSEGIMNRGGEKRDLNGNTKTHQSSENNFVLNKLNNVAAAKHGSGDQNKASPMQQQRHQAGSERVTFSLGGCSSSTEEGENTHLRNSSNHGATTKVVEDERTGEGVFKNPSQPGASVAAGGSSNGKGGGNKRKHRPEPLIIPPQVSKITENNRIVIVVKGYWNSSISLDVL